MTTLTDIYTQELQNDETNAPTPLYQYTVKGRPIPLQRPRVTKNGTYDPQEVEKNDTMWQLKLQKKCVDRQNQSPRTPVHCPINMDVVFYMPIPKSTSKKKAALLTGQPHTKRPDLSNLIKYIEDCAQSILFDDDALIYSITATKIYDTIPRTTITLRTIL